MRRSSELALAMATAASLLLAAAPAYAAPSVEVPDKPLRPGKPRVIKVEATTIDFGDVAAIDDAQGMKATLNANVAFDKDKAILKPQATARLTEVADQLKKEQPGKVSIKGYTDNLGTHEHGVDLSKRRAEAVKNFLAPLLPGFQLVPEGLAEANPIAPNDSETNRAKNRRVEIEYVRPPKPKPAPKPKATPQSGVDAKKVIGKLTAKDDTDSYTIEVHPIQVMDAMAGLRMTISKDADSGSLAKLSFLAEKGVIFDEQNGRPSGVELIDEVGKVRYRPAINPAQSQPLCFIDPHEGFLLYQPKSVTTTCWYAVPTVDKVDVKVGTAGTVKDVPVIR